MTKWVRKSFYVSIYRLRDKLLNRRFYESEFIYAVYLYILLDGVRRLSETVHVKVTPWSFPFVTSDWISQTLMCGYFLWLLSSICSRDEMDWFIIARSGEKAWHLGNCLAVLEFTLLFVLLNCLLSGAVLIPDIRFSSSWGKIWPTIAGTNAEFTFSIGVSVSQVILHLYSPMQATVLSLLLEAGCLGMLGCLMYCLTCYIGKAGNIVVLIVVLMDTVLYNISLQRLYFLSPVSMVQLERYASGSRRYGLSLPWAFSFYIVGILLCTVLSVVRPRPRKAV